MKPDSYLSMPATAAEARPGDLEESTMRKVTLRIVPFLMLCYFFSYIDRVNVGFAALDMNEDIGLGAAAFGLGSGIFFLSYFLFEVPSNILMERVGARYWMARIMITWGLISACTAFVVGPHSYYAVRFLLGAAEAGFFPGVILYLTYFFPACYRARIVAIFSIALPASIFLGSPISAALLGMNGVLGFAGWQWLFLIEALPSVLLGVVCLAMLADSPAQAKWLDADEKAWLVSTLERERHEKKTVGRMPLMQVLRNGYVLSAALVYVGATATSVCLAIWQPQIIKPFGLTNMQTGLVNAIPFGIAILVMVLWARHSDRTGERVWHTAIPLAVICVGLLAVAMATALLPIVLILCLVVSATYAVKGPFWALSTQCLSAGTAAVAIAQINAIGNLGGFLGTYLFGAIKDATGSSSMGLLPLAVLTAGGAMVTLIMGRGR